MGVLPQVLEIKFEVQMKRINEKLARKKKSFSTHKMSFFSLWIPPAFKAFNFLISCSF
jgi:hypothetical protein